MDGYQLSTEYLAKLVVSSHKSTNPGTMRPKRRSIGLFLLTIMQKFGTTIPEYLPRALTVWTEMSAKHIKILVPLSDITIP